MTVTLHPIDALVEKLDALQRRPERRVLRPVFKPAADGLDSVAHIAQLGQEWSLCGVQTKGHAGTTGVPCSTCLTIAATYEEVVR